MAAYGLPMNSYGCPMVPHGFQWFPYGFSLFAMLSCSFRVVVMCLSSFPYGFKQDVLAFGSGFCSGLSTLLQVPGCPCRYWPLWPVPAPWIWTRQGPAAACRKLQKACVEVANML